MHFAARVDFETADGQLDEVADVDVKIIPGSDAQVVLSFEIESRKLAGTFQPIERELPDDARNEEYVLSFSLELTDGQLSGGINEWHQYETSDGGTSGGGSGGPIATFGAK